MGECSWVGIFNREGFGYQDKEPILSWVSWC